MTWQLASPRQRESEYPGQTPQSLLSDFGSDHIQGEEIVPGHGGQTWGGGEGYLAPS